MLVLAAVAISGILLGSAGAGPAGPVGLPGGQPSAVDSTPAAAPSASASAPAALTLTAPGATPAAVSLSWTESTALFFDSYTVSYSSNSSTGPFETAGVITAEATTQLAVTGFSPGESYWWEVASKAASGTTTSNVLEVTQPTLAYLYYTAVSGTADRFDWTNNASYGGLLSFSNYSLFESVAGAPPTRVAAIVAESTMTYEVTGLTASTSYTFYLNTTDCFAKCGTGTPTNSVTESNLVTAGTPLTLGASISESRPVVDVGQSELFTCTPSGGMSPFTFAWNVSGGGYVGGNSSESFSFPAAGTTQVGCRVTDADHDIAESATSITVNGYPTLVASLNRTTVDIGQSIEFSCTPVNGTPSFFLVWNFGDGNGFPDGATTYAYTAAGSYVTTCLATDSVGAEVAFSASVIVSPTLTASLSVNSLAAAPGTALSFTAQGSNGSGGYGGYSWSFADGTTGTGPSLTHAFAQPGHYEVTLHLNDTNGGTATTSTTIAVSPVAASWGALPSSAHTGTAITFRATASGGAGGPYNYTWHYGDGTVGFGNVSTHSYATTGTFHPTLTVTDRLGATNNSSFTALSVSAPPPAYSWLTGWVPLVIAVVVGALIAIVILARRRSEESAEEEQASNRMFPVDPKAAVSGTKVCRVCGTQNVAIRETCFHCGADLPKATKP